MKITRTDHPRWKYRVDADISYRPRSLCGHRGYCELKGSDGEIYAVLYDGRLTIFKGYHFDGATCAPDFAAGLEGFAVHDAMFEVHTVSDFQLLNFYHWGVSSWPRKLYKLFNR